MTDAPYLYSTASEVYS